MKTIWSNALKFCVSAIAYRIQLTPGTFLSFRIIRFLFFVICAVPIQMISVCMCVCVCKFAWTINVIFVVIFHINSSWQNAKAGKLSVMLCFRRWMCTNMTDRYTETQTDDDILSIKNTLISQKSTDYSFCLSIYPLLWSLCVIFKDLVLHWGIRRAPDYAMLSFCYFLVLCDSMSAPVYHEQKC